MSNTLDNIMNHWTSEFPPQSDYIDLPFNIEDFCRENDAKFEKLKKRNEFLEECFNCSKLDMSDIMSKAFNRGVGE